MKRDFLGFLKRQCRPTAMVLIILLSFLAGSSLGQNDNRIPFRHRVGTPPPNASNIFNIRGDFTIIGNTNLTLANYSESTNNSNNQMVYVDADNDPSTINSSRADLVFSRENGADPSCSEILYAGLYWSGRATPGLGEEFQVIESLSPGSPQTVTNQTQNVFHSNTVNFSSYSLSISREGSQGQRYVRYTLSSSGAGDTYQFEFTNSSSSPGRYRIGTSGDWTTLSNQTITTTDGIGTLTFSPIVITDGQITLSVNRMVRNAATNGNTGSYQNTDNFLTLVANGTYTPLVTNFKTLNKRKVKIKGPAASSYTEVTASQNHILYPNGELADMFVGYADITQYVQSQGIGSYSIGDLALTEGNGGNTGFYGHWGIVVVYKNSKMAWRDVTIFDGYSFVQSPGDGALASGELSISGFNAVQNGDVKIKMGVMAGEGDRGISGDFLEIRNAAGTAWERLTHPLNSSGNFFNSSIYTPVWDSNNQLVETSRFPSLVNNTGIDIAMWEIPNPGNTIIANSQTSTTFRYGTTQDLYNIYAIAFAVDAYVPEVVGLNQVKLIDGIPATANPTILPGGEIEYHLDIRNQGSEGIENGRIIIPIPYTATYLSASEQIFFSPNQSGGVVYDPSFGATGAIIWQIGTIPVPSDPNEVLARLTYRFKATEDCFILSNANCEASIAVNGVVSGRGSISRTEFNSIQLIQGYLDGACIGEPIQTPLTIPIVGAEDFVQNNCREEDAFKFFYFCNVDSNTGIPVDEIRNSFPRGTRFFDGPDPFTSNEYDGNNPFPANDGIYYAIPPSSNDCVFQFNIFVTIVVTSPNIPLASDLQYCIGEAVPDMASLIRPSNFGSANPYSVFFFTQQSGGIPQSTFQVNSGAPGQTTFWVAEGFNANCLGPRVPVTVTVFSRPSLPQAADISACFTAGQSIRAEAQVAPDESILWYDQPIGGQIVANPILNAVGSITFYAEAVNSATGCASLQRTAVTITLYNCSIVLEKTGQIVDIDGNGRTNAGDKIAYVFSVSNPGNIPVQNISLSDSLISLVGSPIAVLNPGATIASAFTGEYFLTQADIDDGFLTNLASIQGEVIGENVTATDSDTQNFLQVPSLSISKQSTETSFSAPGTVLNYTVTVTNTGNVTLSNVVVVDPLTGLNQTIPSLAPTASQTFNTSYTIVQSDLDNGSVANTASASSGSVSVSDQVTVNAVQSPALSINKTVAEGSFDAVGDVLNYKIVVTNTGNVTLSNVVVVDPLTGLNQTIASLAPTASQSFNTSYVVTQADIDNGSVGNTASATSGSVSVSDQVVVNAVQSPALSIQKTVAEGSYDAVGDVLNYTIVVTNTGNVTLSNVLVVDPLTGLNQTIPSLAPTASQSFNASYTIVQSDLDNGSVTNTASASSGSVSVSDQVTVNAVQSPALGIQKTAAEGSYDAVGDLLNYTIVVTNTGNVTLSNVVVVDPLTGLNQNIASLAPTASQNFNTSYTIVQSDLDNGSVANTASASSGTVFVSDQVIVNATQNPALSIDKSVAESSFDAVGDVLNYTIVVTNAGNTTLSNVVVVDPLTGLNQTIPSLAPTASQSFNISYTIVQSDLDNGSVANTASASSGSVSVSDQVVVNAVQSPALGIQKTAAEGSFDAVGDLLNYTIVVTNTGNVTLSNVVVVDPLTGLNQTIPSLAPTASQTFNTSYTIVQSDLDNGSVANIASASSGSVSVSDQVVVNAVQSPALGIQKTAAEGSYDAVGDVLNYTIGVTNTGNVTLSNVVVVDPLTGLNQTIPSLAPTASQSFNSSYTIVQSDLDNGSVVNTASASSGSVSVSDQVVVNAVQSRALSIQKTVAEGSYDAVGDVLNYTVVVTNTGNVTLSNVVVVDPLTGLNQTISSLAPTASQSFNTSYTIIQSDLDNGSVANTASASSGSVSVSDQVVVNAVQSPALSIQKTVAEGSYSAVGDVLNYTIVVTNTGNVTLSNVLVVDPLTGLNQTIATLAPGASQSFNTSYTIVQSDLDNGSVANTASASSGSVSVSDQVVVNAVQSPALSIQKTVAEGSFDAVGDVLNYTVTVTNTGNVTLSNVVVVDPLTGLNQTIASLAPTASQSFNTSYTIVQSDLDNGSVANTASASSGSVSVSDQVVVSAVQSPAISIDKSVAESSFDAVGDVLNYTIVVTNAGNTTLSNVVVVDPLTGLNQTIPSLAPTASESFNNSYTIVQSDLDNGSVANTASASSGAVSVSDQVVVNAVQSPALSIQKTVAEGSYDAVGDVLNYTVVVTNTGNTTLSNVVVVDPLTGLNQTIASLAPTASQSFNTAYVVTQADIDNGSVANTASASSGSVSVSDQVVVSAVQSPAISIDKSVAESSFDAVGDVLNYTIVVTNTGNVTLSNVLVVDPLTGLNQTIASLAPTASQSFNTTYTIVQSDLDNGSVGNTASASSGSVSVSDQVVVNAVQSPALGIQKTAAEGSYDAVGDVLNYTIVVTNTGNVTLSNVVVVDPMTGLNQTIPSLAPTASQSFNTFYTIVQSDLDNGSVANTANASSGSVNVSDQVVVNAVQSPALGIQKTVAEGSFNAVGDVLNYTIVVTNTGNVTLSNVLVVDPLTGLNQTIASLAPTASQSFNTSYVVTQTDIDNGSVANTASASSGSVSVSDQVVVNAVQSPALSVQKTAAEGSFDAVGDVLNYTIVVTNTGNVTLSNVLVVDPLTGLNQTIASLAPTASQSFNTSYTIVQSDLDNGSVANTASASSGSLSVSDQVVVNAVQSPALSIAKSVAESSFDAVGDVLNYTITVTNTGNTTLSNVVVADPLTSLNQTIATLAPGASQSFNTSYTIVQSDLDNGSVANTASASSGSVSVSDQVTVNAVQSPALSIQKTVAEGSYDAVDDVLNYTIVVTNTGNTTLSNVVVADPLTSLNQNIASLAPTASQSFNTSYTIVQSDLDNGSVANTASASSGSVSVSDQVTVNAVQSPALSIDKSVAESSFDAVGDVLNYTITVTNTGNVTLSNVAVIDPLTGLNQTIPGLAPTASQSFNTSYSVIQTDIDNGSVANTASASSGSVNVSDQVVVSAVQSSALSIDKSVAESSFDAVGDVLNYTIVVTNTGNVTLSNVLVVDPLTGLNQTIPSLAPTASQSFNASYTIVQSDLDNGSVTNMASASSGSVSVSDQVTVNAVQSPALSIQKTVPEGSFEAVGDVLNYTIVVTNTGNVTLSNVVVVDPLTGLDQTIASLAPTASQSFNTSYTIVQSDLDNGSVANTASASSGSVNVSDQVVVSAEQSPALSIDKSVAESSFDAVGDVLNYIIVVTNTGNLTISNVLVVDPLTGLNQTISSLAPTASQSFNTSYTIVQSDLDNGSVANTASASSGSVSVSDQVTVNAVQSPALSINKTVAEGSFDAVGDVLNYTVTVTNTGNVTLSNVVVVDPLTGLNQNIASLAPTASQSFNTSYTIVQSDLDNGSVANTASATSGPVSVSDQVTVNAVQSPALSIDKSVAESSFDAVGDVLNYTITVTNTGNVTLSNVAVIDPLTGLNQTIASLAPTASQSFNTSYTIVQSDIDAGSVNNTASASSGAVSVSDQVVVNAVQSPALSIQKTVAGGSFSAVGDVLNYTIVVTNTGNTTLSNVFVVDPLTGLNQTIATLAPGASQSFNTSYTIVQSDLDNGSVANTASATSGPVSVSDQVVVDSVQSPALSIQKTVAEDSYDAVGDVLNYTIVVTNTGNTTLSNVVVVDPLTGLNQTIASLAPTASQSFNTSYVVTQADLDKGEVLNIATASTKDIVVTDEVLIIANSIPAIDVTKTADLTGFSQIGQTITYTIIVKNAGNVTLGNVIVSDPLTAFEEIIENLAPGQSVTFQTKYQVTEEDLEKGSIFNIVNATGKTPDDEQVSDSDSVTIGSSFKQIIAVDDNLGEYPVDFGGVLGNILSNDLLDNKPVDWKDVNFEFSELAGVVGLLINENGELSLVPGLNPPGEYVLKYVLREALNPANQDEATVTFKLLVNDVDLAVSKTSKGVEIFEGDEFDYEILVENVGETDATNVLVVDELPSQVTYLSSSFEPSLPNLSAKVSVSGSKVTYTIDQLPAKSSILIRMRVRANAIDSDKAQSITNIVTISSEEEDLNPEDNRDTDLNQINPFFIPNVITPSGNGMNDRFEIKGINKFASTEIVIFNRNGDHVYEMKNYKNDWTAEGLVAGTYFYVLKATDRQGKEHEYKGWIQVIK